MLQKKPLALAVSAALGLGALVLSAPGFAQDAAQGLEEVVVTGSRIQKANLITSSPVTQIDSEQLTLTGLNRIEDALQSLPQVFLNQDSGQSIEANGTATLELRNLGIERTLVLVDGKRLPISTPSAGAGADLNFIPGQLVKRVEVLTGGASSTYGSDAVAGVVNFIMIDDFEGVKLDYQFSRYRHDNSGNFVADGSKARGFEVPEGVSSVGVIADATFMIGGNINEDRGNITAYATYRKIEAIEQRQRDTSSCAIRIRDSGTSCGGSGTNAAGTFYFENDGYSDTYYVDGNELVAGQGPLYNFAGPSYSQRPDERYTLGAFAHYEVNEHVEVYSQLMFMDDRSVAQFGPAGIFFDGGFSVNCDNPYLSAQQSATIGCSDPSDVIGMYVGRRNIEGGPRFGDLRHSTYRGVFGLRGDINDNWQYDVSYQYAEVDMRNRNGNYFDTTKAKEAILAVRDGGQIVCSSGNPDCSPYNIWSTGGVSPEATAYLAQQYFERGTTDQTVFTAYVSGNLADYGIKLPSAENGVSVVLGVEKRDENLDYMPDDLAQAGSVGGLSAALEPVSGGYGVAEWFAEASIPLIEGKDFFKELVLDLGYRYSDYDTGVLTDTYKVAAGWAINDQVKLRGSYQRAVRAPNITELFAPQSGGLFAMANDPCADVDPATGLSGAGYSFEECARSGVTQAVWDAGGPSSSPAQQYNSWGGGSTELDPEESDTWSAGFILTPGFAEGLVVSLDWYDIKVDGAISAIDAETALTLCIESSQFCDKVNRGVRDSLWLGNSSPTNGVTALADNIGFFRVKGFDIEASYSFDVADYGTVNVATQLGIIDSYEYQPYDGAEIIECQGVYGGSCGTPLPELRNRFTTTWMTPWDVTLNLTWRFLDKVDQISTDLPNIPVEIDSQSYFDLAGTWTVTDYASVRLGVNNLLDEEAPIVPQGATARENGNTYPGIYDHLGQYWFVGATVQF